MIEFRPYSTRPRLNWPPSWPLVIGTGVVRRKVRFGIFCLYKLPGQAQHANNIIFGVKYKKGNKAMFGWRFEPSVQKIVISAITLNYAGPITEDLCTLDRHKWYELNLYHDYYGYVLQIKDEAGCVITSSVYFGSTGYIGWLIGPRLHFSVPYLIGFEIQKG